MPEGDTIFKTARTLHRALAGQPVTRFETGLAQLSRVDTDHPIAGRSVERVEAAGKHLLLIFSGALILRTHMHMNGSWHIYRPGEQWQRPRSSMRIVIETPDWVAVAFRVHEAEFIQAEALARHKPVATLGPDLLSEAFDVDEALRRIREHAADRIEHVLLNQRVIAGIGNIYKSEVLFLAGVHPDVIAGGLSDEKLRSILSIGRRLLVENVVPGRPAMMTYPAFRRTTRRMRLEDRFWVYGRRGRACRKCGTPIASRKTGDDARVTYWCPQCQPLPA